ncbi:sensor histidine kinase [Caldalkalibacillus mannanilyticus]|uniref:sensor histidine kinase n=1 Tax=Caldalkalibacillus mannanilyticus TaxID=1418 RepID=UPI000A5FFB3D|nr:histidine kinase [Caldalkalibacillus mannanilyticus]
MMINNSNGMSISLFLSNGSGIWEDNPYLNEEKWYQDFTIIKQQFTKAHIDSDLPLHSMRESHVISFILPIIDMNTFVQSGIIKVNFPSILLERALNKMTIGQNGRAYLLTKQGENVLPSDIPIPLYVIEQSLPEIINDSQQKGLIELDYNGESYFIFFQKLSVGDWILISEVTESDLFINVHDLQRNLLITSAVVFMLTIVSSFMLSSNIVSPLGNLAKAMGYIERGDFTGAKQYMSKITPSKDEVGYVLKVFDHTIAKLKNLIETEYEVNLRRKDAEYKALLLQINPHFLNNTLEIIGSLALQEKNKEVVNVSVYLGKMMRYSLNTKSSVVKLAEEVNYIRSYTDILKLRYEDSLSITIEEDPDVRSFPVIKFILQPLVENAVKYSFIQKNYAWIRIRTQKVGEQVWIVVEDKGIGMSENIITNVVNQGEQDETINVLESKGKSIGLRNVLGRLQLYYGHHFSYRIDSQMNEGTKITLCIQCKRGEIHDEGHTSG